MEEAQQQTTDSAPSYWTSVGIAALIFGVIAFAFYLISSYYTINSEPTGSFITLGTVISVFSCLFSAFAGLTAVWHYTKEYDLAITLGKGALIGLLTGAVLSVITTLLMHVWSLLDPTLVDKLVSSTVDNYEAMGMQSDAIDQVAQSIRDSASWSRQLLWGIPISGLLNLLTGMIGAKVFSKKED